MILCRVFISAAVFISIFPVFACAGGDLVWQGQRCLWYDEPASEWRYGLPVGNGRLGAMVLGTYPKERI